MGLGKPPPQFPVRSGWPSASRGVWPFGLICMIAPSCGETRFPHGEYEHCTLRSGRLPARCAAAGSCDDAPLCAVGPGATATAIAIAHAATNNDRIVWLTISSYSSTTTYSLPATVIDRMNPSLLFGSGSFHAGEMR